jgi:anti-sigma factor RsiW
MSGVSEPSHLEQWVDRLQDSIDGTLDASEQATVSEHLKSCIECSREHAQLMLMDKELKRAFATVPALSPDFSSNVFASIEAADNSRKTVAKQRAELEFQARMRAFGLDWNEIWQRHMGSIVAAVSVIGGLIAALGTVWNGVSTTLIDKFPAIAMLGDSAATGMSIAAIPITLSAAALWILRTRTR